VTHGGGTTPILVRSNRAKSRALDKIRTFTSKFARINTKPQVTTKSKLMIKVITRLEAMSRETRRISRSGTVQHTTTKTTCSNSTGQNN
tara:strand:- start:8843 stop:9109 length:267 start_codon:yes stop_codon:yes gene_type:complete